MSEAKSRAVKAFARSVKLFSLDLNLILPQLLLQEIITTDEYNDIKDDRSQAMRSVKFKNLLIAKGAGIYDPLSDIFIKLNWEVADYLRKLHEAEQANQQSEEESQLAARVEADLSKDLLSQLCEAQRTIVQLLNDRVRELEQRHSIEKLEIQKNTRADLLRKNQEIQDNLEKRLKNSLETIRLEAEKNQKLLQENTDLKGDICDKMIDFTIINNENIEIRKENEELKMQNVELRAQIQSQEVKIRESKLKMDEQVCAQAREDNLLVRDLKGKFENILDEVRQRQVQYRRVQQGSQIVRHRSEILRNGTILEKTKEAVSAFFFK